jgi:hypothetical protein
MHLQNIVFVKASAVSTRDALDTDLAGYPANPKAGYPVGVRYRISGRISCIRPDFMLYI